MLVPLAVLSSVIYKRKSIKNWLNLGNQSRIKVHTQLRISNHLQQHINSTIKLSAETEWKITATIPQIFFWQLGCHLSVTERLGTTECVQSFQYDQVFCKSLSGGPLTNIPCGSGFEQTLQLNGLLVSLSDHVSKICTSKKLFLKLLPGLSDSLAPRWHSVDTTLVMWYYSSNGTLNTASDKEQLFKEFSVTAWVLSTCDKVLYNSPDIHKKIHWNLLITKQFSLRFKGHFPGEPG